MRALFIAIPVLAAVGIGAASVVVGQERQGRFAMSPVENGFVRLDTETGDMSICTQQDGRWTCRLMEDEAKALQDEVARLRDEVSRLRAQAAAPGTAPPSDRPEPKLELPSEEEIDKALDYFENIFRKLRERIDRFEREERERDAGTPKGGTQL